MKSVWQVQEAKAELSALIKAAQEGPQIITRHGTAVAVLLSYAEYQQLQGRNERPSLLDFFRSWPNSKSRNAIAPTSDEPRNSNARWLAARHEHNKRNLRK